MRASSSILYPFIQLLTLCTLLASCDSDDNTIDPYDVIAYGSYDGNAAYWHNGKLIDLGAKPGSKTFVRDGVQLGTDLYLTGYNYTEDGQANGVVVWKNGTPTKLPLGYHTWQIIASGSDIYVAGSGETGKTDIPDIAMYWKNGEPVELGTFIGDARGIAISGSDVHVVGWEAKDDSVCARYWKNGKLIKLPIDMKYTYLHTIAIDGPDVYIGGYASANNDNDQWVKIWKNQVDQSPGNHGQVTKIVVSDGDVYTLGNLIGGSYKKNGEPVYKEGQIGAVDIAPYENVFVVTQSYDDDNQLQYTLFKDQSVVKPFDGTDARIDVMGIIVGKK